MYPTFNDFKTLTGLNDEYEPFYNIILGLYGNSFFLWKDVAAINNWVIYYFTQTLLFYNRAVTLYNLSFNDFITADKTSDLFSIGNRQITDIDDFKNYLSLRTVEKTPQADILKMYNAYLQIPNPESLALTKIATNIFQTNHINTIQGGY